MTHEERLVYRDVLHADDAVLVHVDYLVDQLERIPVGQQIGDLLDVHDRRNLRIVGRDLRLLRFQHQLFDFLGECDVGRVAGACCQNLRFERPSDQRQVADNVQQFVPGRFVGVVQVDVIENTFSGNDADAGLAEEGSQ